MAGHTPKGARRALDVEQHLSPLARLHPERTSKGSDRAALLSTIEGEIIPRLMLIHSMPRDEAEPCAERRHPPTDAEVATLVARALRCDLPACLDLVEELCRQGLALHTVLLELVSPAARRLGEDWLTDHRSFTEVTVALGTLQQVVHVLGPSFVSEASSRGLVVLTAAPREQHTLGLYVVGEFLRRAGWSVQVDPGMGRDELFDVLANDRVEMLGFSASGRKALKVLAALIGECRECSRNPSMVVMVGGSLEPSEYAELVPGAVYARDARETVKWLGEYATAEQCLA